MQLPDSISIDDLKQTHPDYCRDAIDRRNALYRGGRSFDDHRKDVLVKRELEEKGDDGGRHFNERLKRAWYINRAGGMIDYMAAKALGNGPVIQADAGVSEESAAFWTGLNENCDGIGTDFADMVRLLIRDALLKDRSYLLADFPSPESLPDAPATANAVMVRIAPDDAIDWYHDSTGRLQWLKRHSSTWDFSDPWKRTKKEKHVWTFFHDGGVDVYEAIRESGQFKTTMALRSHHIASEFGVSVFDVRYGAAQQVMARIQDVAVALFNAEADLAFALAKSAHPVPVLISDRDISSLSLSACGALTLRPGESIAFVGPTSQFDPHYKNIDRLKMAYYETVHALAKEAASISQIGRASGETIRELRDPLETLLATFARPVADAVRAWIRAVATHRGDDPKAIRLAWPIADPVLPKEPATDATLDEIGRRLGMEKDKEQETENTEEEGSNGEEE